MADRGRIHPANGRVDMATHDREVIGYNPDDIDWGAPYRTEPDYLTWRDWRDSFLAMLLVLGVLTMGLVSVTILVALVFKLWRAIWG